MSVHIFGAASSPSIANFALKKAAEKAETIYSPVVAETICQNFYVDDCLRSVADEGIATKLIHELSKACQDGGFHLTKFTSNSKKVMSSVPESDRARDVEITDLGKDDSAVERALGIRWHTGKDVFVFSSELKERPMTRRGLLSTVASVYDPLGFIAPYVMPAKKLLQQLCKETIKWDDDISDEQKVQWQKWLTELSFIEELQINRCLKPVDFGSIVSSQIHVFADASTLGYGAAAYIRLVNDKGDVHVAFLMGKARVTPLKTTTIPRLELTAASVAVNIGRLLLRELQQKIDEILYHTNSTTVLHYNKKKRYPIFIANRVQVIQEFTEIRQWRYVDSKLNPADIASRGQNGKEFLASSLWLNGPQFLKKHEIDWPDQPVDLEVEDNIIAAATSANDSNEEYGIDATAILLHYYSDWSRLRKAVAIYRRFFQMLRAKHRQDNPSLNRLLNVQDLKEAEIAILKVIQKDAFPREFKLLENPKSTPCNHSRSTVCVPKTSSLYRLDPFFDCTSGLMRVGGRLSKANVPEDMKHPILLPYKHHVTTVIIRHVHQSSGHVGRNHTLSQLREKYWIIHANSAVRTVIIKCVACRRARAPVASQKMADLPEDRVTPAPPFTCCGVDCFGPFIIKEKRKEMKRYGVIFTCLASRAIHLETVNSLETGSFIQALRRFIVRRGQVQTIRSDNGTNFRGADRELTKAVKEMSQDQIQNYLLENNIKWEFNPPTASHMGGIWELQIRSVRQILVHLLKEFGERLDDESFRTLLCEVEAIVNSRPLTPASSDPDDLSPLSPSHILTLKNVITAPPGDFQKEDVFMRRRWRGVQYLANIFWTRWRKEYLASLQERQKWITKERNISVGDIVLIKDENLSRNCWRLGRVYSTEPDNTDHVRSVHVKTENGNLHRPVAKLVLLLPNKQCQNDSKDECID